MSTRNPIKSLAINNTLLLLLLTLVLFIITAILYLKLSNLDSFLKQISYVQYVYLPNNQIKKIIYTRSKDYPGENIFLTNSSFDPNSAIKIASGLAPGDLRRQTVNYYNRTYFVQAYGTGEGCNDYLIFDEDGKVITKALLQEIDKSQLSISYICNGSIQHLSADGKLTLRVSDGNPPQKEYILETDITSGKLKNVLHKQ